MELPAERQIHWILRNIATLLELGTEPVHGLVTPTSRDFPDAFDGSPGAVAALLARIQHHAGLSDLSVDLSLVTPEGEEQKVSCSSGACGGTGKIEAKLDRVARREDGSYAVMVGTGEAKSPVVLTTGLVRAVSFMFLSEAGGYADLMPSEREAFTDLAGVLLGFGVLLANGSYLYMKGCGGVQVHSATRMPVEEIALSLGIFCRLHEVTERAASKHLELTPAEAFEESYAWASSNDRIVKLLRSDPNRVRAEEYSLSPAHSWIARTLGFGKKKSKRPEDELAELERAVESSGVKKKEVDPAKAKKLAELRALVDESFEG